MNKNLPVIPCGIAIIRRGREFLIAQRHAEDTFGSYWEFPGGKKRREESFEECVVREVREEIGIEISVLHKFMEIRHPYTERVVWLNFFLCSYISGKPQPLDCQAVRWIDMDDLRAVRFPPANEAVVEKLLRGSIIDSVGGWW